MSTPKFVFLMDPQQMAPATGIQWADWANVVAALIVAGAAVYGLSSWKREHRSKRSMELAETILCAGYECLDAIAAMRVGWLPAWETERVKQHDGESDEDYRHRRAYDVTFDRYREHSEKFAKLLSLRFRAEVLFSEEHRLAIEKVQRLANQVTNAAQDAFRLSSTLRRDPGLAQRLPDTYQNLLAKQHAAEDVLWGLISDNDTMKPEIDAARRDLERLFRRLAADGE